MNFHKVGFANLTLWKSAVLSNESYFPKDIFKQPLNPLDF